jgi:hypothetical protein
MAVDSKDTTVEKFEYLSQDEAHSKGAAQHDTMGTVTILHSSEVYLVPSPSADPRGTPVVALTLDYTDRF